MRPLLAAGLLLLGLGACHYSAETPEPDNPDWYMLKAPEAQEIVAVTGDIDKTLIITTRYKIFRTTNRGQTWQQCTYPSNIGLFGFAKHRGDTLLALESGLGMMPDSGVVYASNVSRYSADDGRTWLNYPYTQSTVALFSTRVPLNRVRTPAGHVYRVSTAYYPTAPNAHSYYVHTTGVEGDNGPLPKLPYEHQINSLYLDQQARLYIAATAPLTGQGKDFAYAGEKNGVLYVSKQPLK